MNDETLGRAESDNEFLQESDGSSHRVEPSEDGAHPATNASSIVVAATFTADPLQEPLTFWMQKLRIRAKVVLAPYAQLMQELLSPLSEMSQNETGFNILLVRPEDWIRDRLGEGVSSNRSHLWSVAADFVVALASMHARANAPTLVFICPTSESLPDEYAGPVEEIRRDLLARASRVQGVHCWEHADLVRLYPVEFYQDPSTDRIGHIPYTQEYFVALATLFARRIAVLSKPQPKVIAIDCDNTLWKGICGEDGAEGIELTPAHVRFQELLIRQHDAGVLLCLCSKNNPADVEAVFKVHPEMPIREEHLICSRINWEAKSGNLRSLAEELSLGLDSFVLVDDSAVECAEVAAHCPEVLRLQFPTTTASIEHFLDHAWVFDRLEATEDAKKRTLKYRQNHARSKALKESSSLQSFLTSLCLQIDLAPMRPEQLPRVAELIQRTNQFNLTAIRRSASEVQKLVAARELEVLVAHVRDRFGDYGLVGVVLFRRGQASIEVDTFLLSCRVLGRGVENSILGELAQLARSAGLHSIALRYRSTPRNAPARKFLDQAVSQFEVRSSNGMESIYTVPLEHVDALQTEATTEQIEEDNEVSSVKQGGAEESTVSHAWHESAYGLSRVIDIMREINRTGARVRSVDSDCLAPRTTEEETIAKIWTQVLRLDVIGVQDDFFDLGGDSLMAVHVIARVESLTGREIPLHIFLEAPTIEKMAEQLVSSASSGLTITPQQGDLPSPLSFAQQRLWFIDQLENGSAAYHIPIALRLERRLSVPALQAALDALMQRHAALRTSFPESNTGPVQKVSSSTNFPLRMLDLRSQPVAEREFAVLDQSSQDLMMRFDLCSGPLIHGTLLQLSDDEHVLLMTMHHIISDGWSVGILVRELASFYRAAVTGQPDSLPPLSVQYSDYARWQRQWLARPELQDQLRYWEAHLSGAPELLELPTDRPRPALRSHRGATVPVLLERELVGELQTLARRFNLTLAMILYTAWTIVLSRLSGQGDIVVGIPVANRRRVELEQLIGFFVNTIAVRVRLHDDPAVADLLPRVKRIMLAAYGHQDAPFEQVVELVRPSRSLSHSPIFQTMFVLQPVSRSVVELPELTLTEQQVPLHTAQFDLSLSLQESGEEVSGALNYASDLFNGQTIERWAGYFKVVLRGMLRDQHVRVSRLPLLSEAERLRVIEGFNDTQAGYPQEATIHQLFEEQVERAPHEVAVRCGEQYLTYQQLNCRANQLARYLKARGAGPDRFVGLFVERDVQMIIGLLGILKAGAAYVPLDPNYPLNRLEYMLKDTQPIAVLTQRRISRILPTEIPLVALDTQWEDIARERATNLSRDESETKGDNLAYVIYTSGSTGLPKGVAIEHRNAVNLICWARDSMSPEVFESTLQSTSLNFDLSVYECFVPLTVGGGLRLVQNALSLASEHLDVTLINTVPSAISGLLDAGRIPATTRVINLAGEALKQELVERIFADTNVRQVCNLYGPSETTTYSTWIAMPREEGFKATIGRPVANTQIYILDQHRQPVPIGVIGEIYIAGAGVARGYLSRPDLVAERFSRDPFSADSRARMYRTGDVGRWRENGTIEYLGRNDHQVKIRGFRIELGEIESQLARHQQVKEAVVIARDSDAGYKQLVAYVVAADSGLVASEELRAYLKIDLPEYMIPAAFVLLDRLPLTPNGKIDRLALPPPDLDVATSLAFEAPRGEIEEILVGIWQDVLKVERVGRHDNFFELGGHSLLIVQVLERLRRVGLRAELRRIFESPTLVELASSLTRDGMDEFAVPPNLIPEGCDLITPEMLPLVRLDPGHIERIVRAVPGGAANIQDIYPLAPLQEGLLFHHLLSDGSAGGDTYVVPTLLALESGQKVEGLIAALQAVVDRHDVLRTAILWEELPQPLQVVYRKARLPVTRIDLECGRDSLEQVKEWLEPELQRLDLRQAPLLRLQVAADAGSGRWYVLLQLHHIVADNTSSAIILAEVAAHLRGAVQQLAPSVPYRNHVAQALVYARRHDAEAFFRSKFADVDAPTAPFGLMNVHGDASHARESHETLDPALSELMRTQARRLGVSTATLFHAAWSLVVAQTSGRDDVVFGTVLLGRLQGSAGAQDVLGMFINTLPLRLRLRDVTAEVLVETTQRELVELLMHEQSSLAVAQRCSGVPGATPLFSSLLNFRHAASGSDAEWANTGGIEVIAALDRTNYPIVASVDDLGDIFRLGAQTDASLDPQRLTAYLRMALQAVLNALQGSVQTPVLALPIMPDGERHKVLELFNAARAEYPMDKLIHQLFEKQVALAPDAMAVVYEGQSLTYDTLNRRANQLAGYLRDRGVSNDQLVGLCVERGIEMFIGQLGILKAGGAYVPLDPGYPAERLAHMIKDAAPRVVLSQQRLLERLPQLETSLTVTALDLDWDQISGYPTDNLDPSALGLRSNHLAYVIYTSGSTGLPKGVMVEHQQVMNLWAGLEPQYSRGGCRRVALNASFNFDASLQQFVQLLSGRTIILIPEEVRRDIPALLCFLKEQGAQSVDCTPSQIKAWIQTGLQLSAMNSLRVVLVGGEAIDAELWNTLAASTGIDFFNVYGPTECTVDSTIAHLNHDRSSPHIGRPMPNRSVYILNTHRQPVPIGVAGELYIGGAGVARGYLNRPELTAERFVDDPFGNSPHAHMYRTGDLGRWRPDGTIEFLGRNDHQVKIRGFRIELGEIEAHLLRHESVKDAVVDVREDTPGDKRLVAYIVANESSNAPRARGAEQWRNYLKTVLPEHMVPSVFVRLECLPTTPSGKLDRQALPVPEVAAYAGQEHVPPQGTTEETLALLWQQLLRIERVGRHDSFFDLGGHSLIVVKLLGEISRAFGSALRVADVYKSPTLHELASRIHGSVVQDELIDLSREAVLDPEIVPVRGVPQAPAKEILLTGATGFVGRFLLARLLEDTKATIHCIVRASTQHQASSRLRGVLIEWDLWREEFEHRIVAVAGDLKRPHLGVRDSVYDALVRDVDCIYHCATSMNHLETYAMAKAANVNGAMVLLELATKGRPKLMNYISTLSVFSPSEPGTARVVNEQTSIDHERHWSSQGYTASKWVSEKLFLKASARGIPCNIFRIGLVWADGRQGRFDELQNVYRMLKTSLLSGVGIKNYRYRMVPTPVDYVAQAVVSLAARFPSGNGIFHISSSMQTVEDVFGRVGKCAGQSLELVHHYDWIAQIKRLNEAGQSFPAVPLIEFAFSMDEASFYEQQSREDATSVRFDCSYTHRELNCAGIVTPIFNDDLLALAVEGMLDRDPELRELLKPRDTDYVHTTDRPLLGRRAGLRVN